MYVNSFGGHWAAYCKVAKHTTWQEKQCIHWRSLVKQVSWIWISILCEFRLFDGITTTKQHIKNTVKIAWYIYIYIRHMALTIPISEIGPILQMFRCHYNGVIMNAMAFQITSFTIVYSTANSKRRSKETSKLRVTGLREGNPRTKRQ